MAKKSLRIQPAQWCGEIAALLEKSAHDPLVGVATLQGMVQAGRATLFEVTDDCALVGAYVLQLNQCEHGRELVLVAGGANLPGFSMTKSVMPFIEQQGAQADRVRVSASRPGMARVLEGLGYKKQAVTYVKALHVF